MRTKTISQSDKMLDAAARLFGTQRFHEVRMEDIASEAEVGKGTLYRYFSDKEKLYAALLDRCSQQLVGRLKEEVDRTSNARGQLEAIVASIITFFDEHPHLFDLIQRAEVLQRSSKEFTWQHTRDELIRLVLDVFKVGNDVGEFSICDPEFGVLMLLGGLRSVIRFGKLPRKRDLAQRVVSTFLLGARAQEKAFVGN